MKNTLLKPETPEKPQAESGSRAPICSAGICDETSHGAIGWAIRRIESATESSVTLNDGVSFSSPCFSGAKAGEIWAVKHEPGAGCFGAVNRAVLLEPNVNVEATRGLKNEHE